MAPTTAAIGGLLRQVIYYHLDNGSYDNALFFAERSTAQDPKSCEAAYLYALCHLRLQDYRSAYDVGKTMGYRGAHLGCSWVFAQACWALDRYKDGIHALEKSRGLWSQRSMMGKHTATSRTGMPDAATVLCLLGKLYRAYDDKKKAISCFEESLKLSPFMWDAFTSLCDMGVNVRVPNIFKANESLLQNLDTDTGANAPMEPTTSIPLDHIPKKSSLRNGTSEALDPFSTNMSLPEFSSPVVEALAEPAESDFMAKIQAARSRLAASTNSQPGMDGTETPLGTSEVASTRSVHSQEPPQAPPRRMRAAQVADPNSEAPPRMNYRLGARRNIRTQAGAQEQGGDPMSDAPNSSAGTLRPSIPAGERKRTVSGHPAPRPTNSSIEDATARRSARLNMFNKPSIKPNSGVATIGASAGRELKKTRPQISRIVRPGSSGSSVGRVVSGNRKPLEDHQGDVDHGETSRVKEVPRQAVLAKPAESDAAKIEDTLKWALDLMKKLGNGYYMLSRFQCQEALQALTSLPTAQQNTPWVLHQIGRAHFEQASYAEAEKFFRKMRVLAPSRLDGMEVYSIILWHLKREADLSFLAHELVDSSWHSPQAWCALGNAWSLARDTEQALRCFKRATQLNPKFAYAFTLQGHEHFANEEYDKALTAYRQAISADRRHYNAYYGIGKVHERLGAYDKAYTHFHAAQSINPRNPVLICCIGTALEKQKHIMMALQAYNKAVELAPRAGETRYRKARALLAVGQLEAAQKELMILKDLAPDEARVHFLLGTLYKTMNEKQLAVRHFTIALALDPKVRRKKIHF
jgi:anaphase-promoting complex subunit 3